jgi:histidinol-phosphatase
MVDMAAVEREVDEELAFAHELADIADRISTGRFRSRDLRIEHKVDTSPVTETDLAVERALVDRITRDRPDDAVIGEELGANGREGNGYRWILDPIDGTKSYVRGNETWATLIALQHDDETVVAVASAAAFGSRYHATLRGGAFVNGDRLRVSTVNRVEQAIIAHTHVLSYERVGKERQFLALAERCWDSRGFGNSLGHLSVARGTVDIAWTPRGAIWDFAALKLIVEEAGGRFTDASGVVRADGGNGVSTNGILHDAVMTAIRD